MDNDFDIADFLDSELQNQIEETETISVDEEPIIDSEEPEVEIDEDEEEEDLYAGAPGGLADFMRETDDEIERETYSFEDEEEEEAPKVKKAKSKISAKEKDRKLLDKLQTIQVDLNSIKISDSSLLDRDRVESIFKSKKTRQVVACQSAYKAFTSAFNNQEIQNMITSNMDIYSFKKHLMKLIHAHIEDTSIGKLSFEEWTKSTSFLDVNTFLYGIYSETFPGANKYYLNCPANKCKHKYSTEVSNSTLIETRGKDGLLDHINDVIKNVKTPAQARKKSIISTKKRYMCENSKIIIDLRIPTIHEYLEGSIGELSRNKSTINEDIHSLCLFISEIYVPDLVKLEEEGELTFFKVSEVSEIIKFLTELSFDEATKIGNEINEFTDLYLIEYSLKDVKCPNCGTVIEKISINLEEMMFLTPQFIRNGKN